MPDHFGKHGFVRPSEVSRRPPAINVGELNERLDELLQSGAAKREGDKFVVDVTKLGYEKVLGGGRVDRPLEVIADKFSEEARRKLEEAGGRAIVGG